MIAEVVVIIIIILLIIFFREIDVWKICCCFDRAVVVAAHYFFDAEFNYFKLRDSHSLWKTNLWISRWKWWIPYGSPCIFLYVYIKYRNMAIISWNWYFDLTKFCWWCWILNYSLCQRLATNDGWFQISGPMALDMRYRLRRVSTVQTFP